MREARDRYLVERSLSLSRFDCFHQGPFLYLSFITYFFFFLVHQGTSRKRFSCAHSKKARFFSWSMSIRFFIFVVKAKHLLLPTFFLRILFYFRSFFWVTFPFRVGHGFFNALSLSLLFVTLHPHGALRHWGFW